jgi:hypothetical protein
MASTGAVLHLKPRTFVTVSANRRTGMTLHLSVRFLSGLYSTTGVTASVDPRGRKSWMPHRSDKWMNADGTPTEEFFQFVNYLANTKLGGVSAPTLPDVVTTVTTAQEQASTAAAVATGASQQVTQNAEAGAALREAAIVAGVASAASLPVFQITNQLER